jgi:hypothetical protein
MAAVRWTLGKLDEELAVYQEATAARLLRARISDLRTDVEPGLVRRPSSEFRASTQAWVAEATQAMGWVAEQRGLGGARVLDGMSWDLPIDVVWEAWVQRFVSSLGPRCGLVPLRQGDTTRRLNWSTSTSSMGMLIPDGGLRGPDRMVWVDAKYKAHLQLLAHRGWTGLTEGIQDAHRADLHQALAYASLDEVPYVDSLLVYPQLSSHEVARPAVATVASGRRRVRLMLVGLPFGFASPEHRERTLNAWRDMLAV